MEKYFRRLCVLSVIALLGLSSCKKSVTNNSNNQQTVADLFSYATTEEVTLDLKLMDHEGNPLKGLRVNIYSTDLSKHIASVVSAIDGTVNTIIRVPTYMTEVRVRINYLGFDNDKIIKISGSTIRGDFGGATGGSHGKKKTTATTATITPAGGNWYYIGTFDGLGALDYLENPGDVVDAAFLTDVSTTLPELLDIPVNKPSYLAPTNAFDIHMLATGDVWITFVSEGAGQMNTLGYYTYQTNNPPTAANQIDSIFTVYPNASRTNSKGGLNAGDKIYLGEFTAGTSIGWVMMQNGWDDNNDVIKATNPNQTKFYSTYSFNPENTATLRQHNVQLLDAGREIVLVGFEDVRRDYGSDNDFNDLVFYTTVTPYSSLDITGLPPTEYCGQDDDNDGITNCDEDYRYDPDRAYDNYYTGTLAYEDLWPGTGDYDFNDLVVTYNTNQVTDANNKVKDIKTTYTVRALGGSLHHGFGVQIDGLSPSAVNSVTGSQVTQSLVTLSGNGLESGQSDAVVIVYDDVFDHVTRPSGESFMNTVKGNSVIPDKVFQVDLTLINSVDPITIGLPPYNPFMFVGGVRGKEIHLPDEAPTDLVSQSFFGSFRDDSDPGSGRYYRTVDNLPWAIHIDGVFNYPQEYSHIESAYLNFRSWAGSNGANFSDWYLDLPGYRNSLNIY